MQALAEVRALEVEEERLRAVDVLAGRQAQGCAVDETCAHPVEIGGLESAQLAAETEALRREQTSADVVVEEPMAERLVQTTQTSQERQVLSATASMVLLLLSPSMVPVVCLVVCLVVILFVLALKVAGALLVAEAAADVRSGSADDAHGCTRGGREWRNDPQGKKRPRKGWRKRQVRARRRLARRRRRWRRQKKQGRAKMRRFPKPVVQRRRRATTRRTTHATVSCWSNFTAWFFSSRPSPLPFMSWSLRRLPVLDCPATNPTFLIMCTGDDTGRTGQRRWQTVDGGGVVEAEA